MTEPAWKIAYERDRQDPVIRDLERINRLGWHHFSVGALKDLPARFGLGSAPSADQVRAALGPFLVTQRARRLGTEHFAEWDDESRFAVKLFGVHAETRNVVSVAERRERAILEVRRSHATQSQSVQKRPWAEQPLGGEEWRLFVRIRDDVRRKHPRHDEAGEGTASDDQHGGRRRRPMSELPAAVDTFFGRSHELDEIARAATASRIVSLVGTGGAGKTRLAFEAVGVVPVYEGLPVHLVRLDDVPQGHDVAESAVRQFGRVREGRQTWIERLVELCRDYSPMILLLDNCEHLIESCAKTASLLLESCLDLRVLATSREPLAVRGEIAIPVRGLPVDPVGDETSPDALRSIPAVQLFMERALAKSPSLSIGDAEAELVANLVRKLDGLPLALELAAAWAGRLTLGEIHDGIHERLAEVPSPIRGSSERHFTMSACLDWSYRLLSEEERRVLRWVSVFSGGCDEAALTQVLGHTEAAADAAVHRLVDASLVERSELFGRSRYSMLETVRAYGRRLLADAGELEAARQSHLQWCLELAGEAHDRAGGDAAEEWLPRLDAEVANVRAAMHHALERGDHTSILRFAGLWWYWFLRGYWAEVREPLEVALTDRGLLDGEQSRAALAAGTMSWAAGDLRAATDWLAEASRAAEASGDEWCLSQAAHIAGHVAHQRGELTEARALYEQALGYWKDRDASHWLALLQEDIGYVLADLGEEELAEDALKEALEVAGSVHDRQARGNALSHLAMVARRRGKLTAAVRHGYEGVAVLRELGYRRGLATALRNVAEACVAVERYEEANRHLAEAQAIQMAIGHRAGLARTLSTKAKLAERQGRPREAARVMGQVRALRELAGAVAGPPEVKEERIVLAAVRRALGDEAADEAFRVGEQAVLRSADAGVDLLEILEI